MLRPSKSRLKKSAIRYGFSIPNYTTGGKAWEKQFKK